MFRHGAKMYEWLDRVGYTADRAALRREFPDVALHDFESWAAAQDWNASEYWRLPCGDGTRAKPLEGRVAMMTGAAQGIGRCIVVKPAEQGAGHALVHQSHRHGDRWAQYQASEFGGFGGYKRAVAGPELTGL
jgi:hypothetical protein